MLHGRKSMPWRRDRAEEDAAELGKHRKVAQFVCPTTGVCQLCGVGLGKRFSREARKDHQAGHQHTHNFSMYVELFDAARRERWRRVRAQHMADRIEMGVRTARDPVAREAMARDVLRTTGLLDWIDTSGGVTAAKAAVLDFMLTGASAKYAVERHVRVSRRVLVHQVAVGVLGSDNARVVGSLCSPCI